MKAAFFVLVLLATLGPSCGARTQLDTGGEGNSGPGSGGASAGSGMSAAAGNSGASAGTGNGGASAGAGGDITACTAPRDCTYVNTDCCRCGAPLRSELVAVNVVYQDFVPRTQCDGPCPPCAPPPPNADVGQYFVTTCEHERCQLIDIRETTLTLCAGDSDCQLRAGAQCCPSCADGAWVALSEPNALRELVCGDPPPSCPVCVPPPSPNGLGAACVESECVALEELAK